MIYHHSKLLATYLLDRCGLSDGYAPGGNPSSPDPAALLPTLVPADVAAAIGVDVRDLPLLIAAVQSHTPELAAHLRPWLQAAIA